MLLVIIYELVLIGVVPIFLGTIKTGKIRHFIIPGVRLLVYLCGSVTRVSKEFQEFSEGFQSLVTAVNFPHEDRQVMAQLIISSPREGTFASQI